MIMPFWLDKLIDEDPRARLIWNIECAPGHKYVTADREGKREIERFRDKMEGWLQRLSKHPMPVRLYLGFGWFTDEEWSQSPEKCFQEAELQNTVIALGEPGTIYATRGGMDEVKLINGMEEGTVGWEQTTPDCRMGVCYRTIKLDNGEYSTDWFSAHHFSKGKKH